MMQPLQILLLACIFFAPTALARDNAALIIGGYWYTGASNAIENYVELFGCEGAESDSVSLNHLPTAIYLSNGVYFEEERKVIVCGGYSCNQTNCGYRKECYWWEPVYGIWTAAPSLLGNRYNYLMSQSVNKYKPEQGKVPMIVGDGITTEIWDKTANDGEGGWVRHLDINDNNWYPLECMVDYLDRIYHLRDTITELDPVTWNITQIGSVPAPLINSGRCSPADIDGRHGIMTRFGYWYDMADRLWYAKKFPPVTPIVSVINDLWSFNGKPTMFGHPVCNNTGHCVDTEVIQYTWETDSWDRIGSMIHSRTYHTVVEVPGEFCDNFVTTATTRQPVTGTTAAGGTGTTTNGAGERLAGFTARLFMMMMFVGGYLVAARKY